MGSDDCGVRTDNGTGSAGQPTTSTVPFTVFDPLMQKMGTVNVHDNYLGACVSITGEEWLSTALYPSLQ
jgi:hypothetical protein